MNNVPGFRRIVGCISVSALLVWLFAAAPVQASPSPPLGVHAAIPVAQLLRADGTLDLARGTEGTLNLAGWQVSLDPQRGPVFVPNSANEVGWTPLGNGLTSQVNAAAIQGTNVIVGGEFVQVCGNSVCNSGNLTVNNIAKWNGSAWSGLGNGFNLAVHALVVSGTDVYAGGDLTLACGNAQCDSGNVRVNGIARWNGAAWSGVGNGFNSTVNALAVSGSNVFAGGGFSQVCGNSLCNSGNVTMNHIARWSGAGWFALDSGLNGAVLDIALDGSDLYAGGGFLQACGNGTCSSGNMTVNRIAKWNGASWAAVGHGFNSLVQAIDVGVDGAVFAGGSFVEVCGNSACNSGNVTVNRIAKWTGSAWKPLGNGFSGSVIDLAVKGINVYASGAFVNICGNSACSSGNTTANRIAHWNGAAWAPIVNGFNGDVYAVVRTGRDLYTGGAFSQACSNSACNSGNSVVNRVARYSLPNCNSKPAKPQLKKPGDNANVDNPRPRLKWHPTNCADTYTVIVKNTSTGDQVYKEQGVTALSHKPDPLPTDTLLKWYVKACNDAGCTKSDKRNLVVQ